VWYLSQDNQTSFLFLVIVIAMTFHKIAIDVITKGLDPTVAHKTLGKDGMLLAPSVTLSPSLVKKEEKEEQETVSPSLPVLDETPPLPPSSTDNSTPVQTLLLSSEQELPPVVVDDDSSGHTAQEKEEQLPTPTQTTDSVVVQTGRSTPAKVKTAKPARQQ
jgi:hypothetical protein